MHKGKHERSGRGKDESLGEENMRVWERKLESVGKKNMRGVGDGLIENLTC